MTTASVTEAVVASVRASQEDPAGKAAEQILAAAEELARSGLLSASLGDVSVRLPGADHMLVTPLKPFAERLTVGDLLEVAEGRVLHKRARPAFSTQMHMAIYKARADVQAIVHCHAPVATVLGICELPIPPFTLDAVPFADLPRVPVSAIEGGRWPQEVAARLAGGAPAALLIGTGIVAVGEDLRQAVRRALALEDTARILVVCHLLQQVPVALPAPAVSILRDALL
jgi:ribulose-5-phosphate 4-epimerase/fuculose-1-phosphate aldolase